VAKDVAKQRNISGRMEYVLILPMNLVKVALKSRIINALYVLLLPAVLLDNTLIMSIPNVLIALKVVRSAVSLGVWNVKKAKSLMEMSVLVAQQYLVQVAVNATRLTIAPNVKMVIIASMVCQK